MSWPNQDTPQPTDMGIPLAQIVELVDAVQRMKDKEPDPYPENQALCLVDQNKDLPLTPVAYIYEDGLYLVTGFIATKTLDAGAGYATYTLTATTVGNCPNSSTYGPYGLTSIYSQPLGSSVPTMLARGSTVNVSLLGGAPYGAATYDISVSVLRLAGKKR